MSPFYFMKLTKIYVKQSPFGLFYLGKTEQDIAKYHGSGKKWLLHLKAHNVKREEIKTWILHETTDFQDLQKIGRYYSKLFNVKESDQWANLMDEEGTGGTVKRSKESLKALSDKIKNYITIHKDLEQKRVPKEKIDYYYNQGWEKGISKKTKDILSAIRKNKPKSEDLKKKLSESTKGRKKEKVECPHCKKIGGVGGFNRYHFDNCDKKS